MKKSEEIDLNPVRTYPIELRKNKVFIKDFVKPEQIPTETNLEYLFPDILAGKNLIEIANAIVKARINNKQVVFAMGSHVIKCGMNLLIIDLINRGIITALAFNGSSLVHDYELSLIGATSEDVREEIQSGRFGMAEETGRDLNKAINEGFLVKQGLGEAVGRFISRSSNPYKGYSLYATAFEKSIPATVHVAIGNDIIHMHPEANGAAIGACSHQDFRKICKVVANLNEGVWLNIGSAVILPEVFLKSVSIARNLGYKLEEITTANFDMINQYRPQQNVVGRPLVEKGKGINIIGHHEILIPLLYQIVVRKWNNLVK